MTDSPSKLGAHLIHLTEEVEEIESNPDLFHGVLTLYSREILPALEKCGFRRVTPLAREKAPKGPHYTALRDGRSCCICFHSIVSDTISLDALTSEQCEACNDLFPEQDVYYSALLEGSGGLYLFSPTLVKNADGWMTNDTHVEQFLPIGMSKFRTRFRFLLRGFQAVSHVHSVRACRRKTSFHPHQWNRFQSSGGALSPIFMQGIAPFAHSLKARRSGEETLRIRKYVLLL